MESEEKSEPSGRAVDPQVLQMETLLWELDGVLPKSPDVHLQVQLHLAELPASEGPVTSKPRKQIQVCVEIWSKACSIETLRRVDVVCRKHNFDPGQINPSEKNARGHWILVQLTGWFNQVDTYSRERWPKDQMILDHKGERP